MPKNAPAADPTGGQVVQHPTSLLHVSKLNMLFDGVNHVCTQGGMHAHCQVPVIPVKETHDSHRDPDITMHDCDCLTRMHRMRLHAHHGEVFRMDLRF
jgi:hypothetical protein